MEPDAHLRREAERAAYWVRHYAAERGLTLDALAVHAGLGRNSIVSMAKRAPSLRTLSQIACYLGLDVRDLLQDIPPVASSVTATGPS